MVFGNTCDFCLLKVYKATDEKYLCDIKVLYSILEVFRHMKIFINEKAVVLILDY